MPYIPMKEYKLYRLISHISSPPFVAAMSVIIFSPFSKNIVGALLIGLIFLTLAPVIVVYKKYKEGEIDIDVSDKKERPRIYASALASFFVCAGIFWLTGDSLMLALSLSYLIVTALVMLINSFTKISAHTAGLAGPITAIFFYFGIYYIGLYLLLFPVAYARFKLGMHNSFQLLSGAALGAVLTYIIFATVI